MKHFFSCLLFLITLINLNLKAGSEVKKGNASHQKSFWISSEYLECIKEGLPCSDDEYELVLAYFDNYDSTKFTIEANNRDNLIINNMLKLRENEYQSIDSLYTVKINQDTLYCSSFSEKMEFIKCTEIEFSCLDDCLGKVNLLFLTKILEKYKFNLIEKLNLSVDYVLYPNQELNNTCLISKQGNTNNQWIVEKKESGFYLYQYIDSDRDKSVNHTIEKELKYIVTTN